MDDSLSDARNPGDRDSGTSDDRILDESEFGAASQTIDAFDKKGPWIGKIFLSYSSPDRTQTNGIRKLLEGMGHRVFHDHESIKAGTKWRTYLATALDQSDCLALFWTRHARKSTWVREEYETFAQMKPGQPLIPIYGDRTVPLPPLLSEHQVVDLGFEPTTDDQKTRGALGVLAWGRSAVDLATEINGSIDTALALAKKLRKAGKRGPDIVTGVVEALRIQGYPVSHPGKLEEGLRALGGLGWWSRFGSNPLEPLAKPARWTAERVLQATPAAVAGAFAGAAVALLLGAFLAPAGLEDVACWPVRLAGSPGWPGQRCAAPTQVDEEDSPRPIINNAYYTSTPEVFPYTFEREFRALQARADLMITLLDSLVRRSPPPGPGSVSRWPYWRTGSDRTDWSELLARWESDEQVRWQALVAILEANQAQTDTILRALAATRQPPVDPVDPANRTDPVDPNDPVEPANRTDPVDPNDPVDPANRTDPVDPNDPVDPANRTDPVDPNDPRDPVDPVDPEDYRPILESLLSGLGAQGARLTAIEDHLERLRLGSSPASGPTLDNSGIQNLILRIEGAPPGVTVSVPATSREVHYLLLPYSVGVVPPGILSSDDDGMEGAREKVLAGGAGNEAPLRLTIPQTRVLLLPYRSGAVSVKGIQGSELDALIQDMHRFLLEADSDATFSTSVPGDLARLLVLPYELEPLPVGLDPMPMQAVVESVRRQLGVDGPGVLPDTETGPQTVDLSLSPDEVRYLIRPHIFASPAAHLETYRLPEEGNGPDLGPLRTLHDRTYEEVQALGERVAAMDGRDQTGSWLALALAMGGSGDLPPEIPPEIARAADRINARFERIEQQLAAGLDELDNGRAEILAAIGARGRGPLSGPGEVDPGWRIDSPDEPGVFRAPTLRYRPELQYPSEARSRGLHGVVAVEALIDEEGDVTVLGATPETTVAGPAPESLGVLVVAATESVGEWKFYPGTLDGRPIDVRLQVDVTFAIKERSDSGS